ncbi:hypothetical protein [Streptomyces sp. NPDC058297]
MPAISELTATRQPEHEGLDQVDAGTEPLPPAAVDAIARIERALAAA